MKNKVVARLCLGVVLLEIAVVVIAWISGSVDPLGRFNNPFLGESVRWMFRNMMSAVASDWLVAVLLVAVTYGGLKGSGLSDALRARRGGKAKSRLRYRERMGLRTAAVMSIFFFCIIAVLLFLPESLLLSVTGSVSGSPLYFAFFPLLCLWVTFVSVVYGIVRGTFSSVTKVFNCFFDGISRFSPYILLMMLVLHCYSVIKMLVR